MAQRLLQRLSVLALLWWTLTGGDLASWIVGGPAIVAVALWRLGHPEEAVGRFRARHLLRFVPFFFWRSVVGSCDVAWRAMHPALQIEPAMRDYHLHLPPAGSARVFFACALSLLPGTLSASWDGDVFQIHVLGGGSKPLETVRHLEDHVAKLFGHKLDPAEKGETA